MEGASCWWGGGVIRDEKKGDSGERKRGGFQLRVGLKYEKGKHRDEAVNQPLNERLKGVPGRASRASEFFSSLGREVRREGGSSQTRNKGGLLLILGERQRDV